MKILSIIVALVITNTLLVTHAQNVSFKTVSPQEFQKLMSNKNTILIDIRTPEETEEGKIQDAINIDFYSYTFEQEISKLDKNKTILVYDNNGKRSKGAAEVLIKKGYKVFILDGGIVNWQSQGLPVQK